MKVLAVLLALAGTFLYVQAQNVVCGKGTSSKTVTIEDGESYSFKTHKGKKYKGNTECTVDYKMGDTCAEMSFACTKFNTNNKDKKKCKKGDMVTITANGKAKAYCKTKKPKVTSSGDMQVVFSSDAKKHSSGAVCKVTCTEAASTTATTTEAAGGGGAGSNGISWKQDNFSDGKSLKDNFESWNVIKYAWGFEEELGEIIDDTLQVFYPAGSTSPSKQPRGGLGFYASPVDLDSAAEVTLEYELLFGTDFDFVKGGKLPGLFGGQVSCAGGAESEECFSTRFMWRREGDLEVYGYIPNDQIDGFCDDPDIHCNYDYGHSLGRGSWQFIPGDWTTISQTIRLNTPGVMDGSIVVEVNGEEVYRRENLNIRQYLEVKVIGVMFSTFYGGSDSSWAPSKDTQTYFRNFSLTAI